MGGTLRMTNFKKMSIYFRKKKKKSAEFMAEFEIWSSNCGAK
jgi:hypothetical protein